MQINLTPDLSLLAIMVIFIMNYMVVRKFFLKPINEVLDARETETRSAEKLYEDALARFSEATAQTEAQLHAAKREAAQVRDRFRGEASAYRQQVVDKTNAEARQIDRRSRRAPRRRRRRRARADRARIRIARPSRRRAHPRKGGLIMRRLLLILMLIAAPLLFAQVDKPAAAPRMAPRPKRTKVAHPTEPPHEGGGGHTEKTYFGIPGWILKIANMLLFIGVLVYFAGGPVKKAFAERTEAIRRASVEARERREKADRMAGDIQARLAAIEAEVRAIHERAAGEGERQKRELMAAAEAESQKMLARAERSRQPAQARPHRADGVRGPARQRARRADPAREDHRTGPEAKLFQESLREVGEVRS
jgi:F-type H+-transporting ATPase subunit b